MAEPIEPVDGVQPAEPVRAHGTGGYMPGGRPPRVIGEVIAVHRKSGHHEGGHLLDVNVGGEEHTELVVRVLSGPYDDLEGRRVVIQAAPEGD